MFKAFSLTMARRGKVAGCYEAVRVRMFASNCSRLLGQWNDITMVCMNEF